MNLEPRELRERIGFLAWFGYFAVLSRFYIGIVFEAPYFSQSLFRFVFVRRGFGCGIDRPAQFEYYFRMSVRDRRGIDPCGKIEITPDAKTVQLRKVREPKRQHHKIKFDKETGLPHFVVPKGVPPITDEWAKQQLSGFP